MATTSPDNIVSPNTGDPYDLIVDWAATTASMQAALIARANKIGTTTQRNAATTASREGTLWWDTTIGVLTIKQGTGWSAVSPLVQYGQTDGLQPDATRQSSTVTFPRPYVSAPGFQISGYIAPGGGPAWANPSISNTTNTTGSFFYTATGAFSSASAVFSWIAIGVPQLS